MCLETMDTRKKRMKTDYLRKTKSPGSNFGWGLLRVSTAEDEALKRCRASTVNVTIRNLHQGQRRVQPAKSSNVFGQKGNKDKRGSVYEGRPAAACVHRPPPGAMAPENTTQYLMSNVYEDMETNNIQTVAPETSAHVYDEYLSPSSVYAALDCGYDSCLVFQQRDFENVFDSC